MDILDLKFFVEVQYDIFKILSANNIYRSLPSRIISNIAWVYDKNFQNVNSGSQQTFNSTSVVRFFTKIG